MKLKACISFAVLLVTVVNAFAEPNNQCPDYQLKCPECGPNEECVYPNSNGCEGAGIPVCKSTQCQTVRCKGLGSTCPKECPFFCTYEESPCCPFTSEPVCEPVCQTFAPCKVTPCPTNCPGRCHYPDAGSCCPRSGKAVCNVDHAHPKRNGGIGYKNGGRPNEEVWGVAYSLEAQGWTQAYEDFPCTHAEHQSHYHDHNDGYGHGDHYGHNHGHEQDYECEQHDHHHHHGEGYGQHDHYQGDDDYYEGLFVGGINTEGDHECHSCAKTVTDIDISLEFVTTTVQPDDIFCAQYIIPCPDECADSCVYPMDQPCPYTLQPWCPSSSYTEECDSVYPTEGYPYPYFPTYDPYYSTFSSLMNGSGVTETPSFITEVPAHTPVQICPLIFRYCPVECPDSCLRPDVPCPFAVDGYCPGDTPTTTISEAALITPTAETVVGGELMCPLYLLACPICPEGYSCSRETKGHCANTNVPYCVSTISPEIASATAEVKTAAPIFEYYPSLSAPSAAPLNRLAQKVEAHDDIVSPVAATVPLSRDAAGATPDPCAEAGLVRVATKQVLQQLQEHRSECHDCPALDWDDTCPNTCIYRTEDNCCIQTRCLPN